MRIEYLHTASGQRGGIDLPVGINPVRLGGDARNHVALAGLPALAIDNDVVQQSGWRVWNLGDAPTYVGEVTLTSRHDWTPLRRRVTHVHCEPYLLTVLLSTDELMSEQDVLQRLDRDGNEFVRGIHRELVELHAGDELSLASSPTEAYLFQLEEETIELAGRRPDFPTNDRSVTVLGCHLAGTALRGMVIRALVAEAGRHDLGSRPSAAWKRFAGLTPDLETEVAAIVEQTKQALVPPTCRDLSSRLFALEAGFWQHWKTLPLSPRLQRYLAVQRLCKEIKDLWFGYGPLEDLLEDPAITEIMVLDAERIFIEKNNRIERSGRRFLTDPMVIAQRILATANRMVNAATPLADARLEDGSRVNVIIPPLALSGPTITIRRFPAKRITAEDLATTYRAVSVPALKFLEAAVINRRNILVSGGTGTGKTTLLNVLSGFIPPKERIVTIEDTAELQIQSEHVVTLQARTKGLEGTGEVPIRTLLRNSLRMRPDRIIVGECRGGEAIDMLQAMNTGHDGSMATVHANSPAAAIERLVVLVQQDAETELDASTIGRQIATALDLIVQLGELWEQGERYKVVTEIAEVRQFDPEVQTVQLVPLFRREGYGLLEPTGSLPSFLPTLIERGLVSDPVAFLGYAPEVPHE